MDAYPLHMAVAALIGASVVAVSAYYMHRKTLTQLLEFAKTVERDRERDDNNFDAESPRHSKKQRGNYVRRKGTGYNRRASASLPDVTAISGGADGDDKRNGQVLLDVIPAGLPRLHTLPEGMDSMDICFECLKTIRWCIVVYVSWFCWICTGMLCCCCFFFFFYLYWMLIWCLWL